MDTRSLEEMGESFRSELGSVSSREALEALRIKYLGRKGGLLTTELRTLKDKSPEERRELGPLLNSLRDEFESALAEKDAHFEKPSTIDITMPGLIPQLGAKHPIARMEARIRGIFERLGFGTVLGPELETEYYAFDALNIPPEHPARDMWDTFWVKVSSGERGKFRAEHVSRSMGGGSSAHSMSGGPSARERLLMRPHTSPVQVRYMEKHKPPFRIIAPGRTFRHEATDASHEANFHQVEGLLVDESANLSHLKYVITYFLRELFGAETKVRLRPSFFPFVEPGLEVDIFWRDRWLEVMGAGMVHPSVFKAVGYNPAAIRGFAFGAGLDRLTMIAQDIPDIRLLYSGDIRISQSLS